MPAVQGVAILGVTGRMGQAVVRLLMSEPGDHCSGLRLSGAATGPASAHLGEDAAAEGPATGIIVGHDLGAALSGAAVAVDFSRADSVAAHASACARAAVPLLVGTTGLDAHARAALDTAASRIAVLVAPNTSLGIGVMHRLVEFAAVHLGAAFDVEITEAHHRLKRDAPSGTALALGEVVAAARGKALAEVAVFDRHGEFAARQGGSIGFSVLRGGDIVGEHTVTFAGRGERMEITHRATDRAAFARGALQAAAWLVGRPAGLYGMEDVLGVR